MSVKLTINHSQRLVLTPQLRQRIEMLQMTSLELGELIQQQMLENPVLEEVAQQEETREVAEEILDHTAAGTNDTHEFAGDSAGEFAATEPQDFDSNPAGEAAETGAPTDANELNAAERETPFDDLGGDGGEDAGTETRDAFEEIDYGREFQEYLDPGYKTQEFEYKEDAPSFEQFLTRAPSLSEHLIWQLNMEHFDPRLKVAAECVVGNLDADGRLPESVTNEEVAHLAGCELECVEPARAGVMRLDPVGCGARSLRECLLAQLEVGGHTDTLAARLIREHPLSELVPHKLGNLSRQIDVPLDDLLEELKLIRTLDPNPGRRYAADDTILVAPEIFVEKLDDDYIISFVDDGSPRLRISHSYREMLKRNDTSKETKDFIKEKVRSAVDLLRNIDHRQQTIYRVVECIVRRQSEFLNHGVQHIKPMMLKDVAEETGMHLSTISRVVNRKYAHTPQGVIELRRFFTEGMTNEAGEEVSTRIIKLAIKKLIEEEDPKNPITDDQVVKILAKTGTKLSRRTVAKYRDQMQIPGSRERKAPV